MDLLLLFFFESRPSYHKMAPPEREPLQPPLRRTSTLRRRRRRETNAPRRLYTSAESAAAAKAQARLAGSPSATGHGACVLPSTRLRIEERALGRRRSTGSRSVAYAAGKLREASRVKAVRVRIEKEGATGLTTGCA